MLIPTFQVDFNELIAPDLLLLSQEDEREDSDGNRVTLIAGMRIKVWEEDLGNDGQRDDLFAYGVVVLNTIGGWSKHVNGAALSTRQVFVYTKGHGFLLRSFDFINLSKPRDFRC